jgi:hypothetical protein
VPVVASGFVTTRSLALLAVSAGVTAVREVEEPTTTPVAETPPIETVAADRSPCPRP